MNFTQHALDKLEIYGIEPDAIEAVQKKPIAQFQDVVQKTGIEIVRLDDILFVLVMDPNTLNLITVYRTDQQTIDNRKRANRWI